MPISHEAAVARAKKAAATRAYNKAHGIPAGSARRKAPPFPSGYHAKPTPTRHVTRDLRLKQTPKKPRFRKLPTKKSLQTMSNAELEREYRYWWENAEHMPMQYAPKAADRRVYEIRDEHARRAEETHGDLPRIQAHRARRGVKKQRGRK